MSKYVFLAMALALAASQGASAQFGSNFETPLYNASADGVDLNGQDEFYNPLPDTSVSAKVYTYDGNVLGLPQNPDGGDQFVAGTGPAGGIFSRSQRDVLYGDGTGLWTITYDFAATYTGQGPSAQNLGSFSTSLFGVPPPEATYIHLASWVDVNDPVRWNAFYLPFDAAGNLFPQPGASPGPEWEELAIDHWYRSSTTFDLDTNLITEVSIKDLVTGDSATFNPEEWYLGGGAGGGLPPPSGFRFFAGSTDFAGNTLAFDNLGIIPEPATLSLLVLAGLVGLRRRRS